MSRFIKYHPEPDSEWSKWIYPLHKGYKLSCCDCGLVHDFEFGVEKILSQDGKDMELEDLPQDKYSVRFRVRRNQRSTGQVRRHFKSGSGKPIETKPNLTGRV